MRNAVFVQLQDRNAEDVAWVITDSSGAPTGDVGHGSLADCAAVAADRRCVLLAPPTAVTLLQADIPTRNRRRLAKAVPYALEDQLLEDPGDLHFALGEHDASGAVAVAVVAKRHMDHWLDAVRTAGLNLEAIVPAVLALPWISEHWTVFVDENDCMVRTGRQQGFACDRQNLPDMVGWALSAAGDHVPTGLQILDGIGIDEDNALLSAVAIDVCQVTRSAPANHGLYIFAKGFSAQPSFNLLQGHYDQRRDARAGWRAWRFAAGLAALLIATQLGTLWYEQHQLAQRNAKLDARIEAIFRKTFPDTKRVVDARVQMQQGLAALKRAHGERSDGFLDLLTRSGPVLKGTTAVRLERLSYHDGSLELDITASAIATLDQLKRRLEARGLRVEIRSATAGTNNVVGHLRIGGSAL